MLDLSSLGLPFHLPGPDVCWQPSMITFHPSVNSGGVAQHNNSRSSGSATVLLLICSTPSEVDKLAFKVDQLHISFSSLQTGACVVLFLRHRDIMSSFLVAWGSPIIIIIIIIISLLLLLLQSQSVSTEVLTQYFCPYSCTGALTCV